MNDGAKLGIGIAASLVIIFAAVALLLTTSMPQIVFWILIIVGVVVIFLPMLSLNGPDVSVEADRLRVKAPFVDLTIPFSRIDAVECRETFDVGLRMYGYGGIRRGSGDFTNKEFGSYIFAGDSRIPCFVIVRFDGKRIAAFNVEDAERTREIYEQISATTGSGSIVSSPDPAGAAKGHRTMRNLMVGSIAVAVVIIVAVIALAMTAGHVDVSMDDDSVTIDATMMHEDIPFSEISSVELRDGLDYGIRTGGFGGTDISSGTFTNDEFGRYRLAIHNDVEQCIVVHKTDGGVVVFNLSDNGSTTAFYDDLVSALGQPAGTAHAYLPSTASA